MSKFHSAELSLDALRKECTIIQNHDEVKLVHMQGAEVELPVNNKNHFNKAEYTTINGDFSKIPKLVFIPVKDSEEAIIAHSKMVADKGYFIFDEILFVSSKEQRVFGYGVLP